MGIIRLNGRDYSGGGGSSGGHTIVDPNGTDMPQENKLKFTGAVSVSDDAVNGQTVVDVEGGGNYYLNTLYSTEEKKIGYWTDGKPLYEKVVKSTTTPRANAWNTVALPNDISVKIFDAYYVRTTGDVDKFSMYRSNTNPAEMLVCTINNSRVDYQISSQYVANFSEFVVIIQYTKTTDTPELNPQTGGVIYLPTIYSDEEREVGVWRDGKPLYQKSISIGAVTANTVKVIDITSLNVDYVADYIATAVLTNGWKVPLPQTHTSSMSYQAFCRLSSSTQLAVGVGSSVGISDGYVTLQYTKTTDTAGSGTWTPSGANAVHYSTNEQVIGTWTDGSTLYERTVVLSAVTNGTKTLWSDTNISIKNHSGFFRFRSNGNILTLWSRSSDATYKATVEGLGTNTSGVYCDVGMGTARSGLLDLHITVQYTKN